VNILEPMTMATDYVMAGLAIWFGARLWRLQRGRAWPLAFLFTAIGSLTGGTYHAIGGEWLWKVTVYAIGLASFFLLVATRVPVIVALLKFLVYATWMITHDGFEFVIADYGLTLLIVAIVQSVAWFRSRAPSAPWIVGSVAVSVVAAIAQQSGDLHPQFNHNDLYHVIQMVALWLLYRGAREMT
jgi:Family of unknown function (DUF6962)